MRINPTDPYPYHPRILNKGMAEPFQKAMAVKGRGRKKAQESPAEQASASVAPVATAKKKAKKPMNKSMLLGQPAPTNVPGGMTPYASSSLLGG